jgi:hypothetical protein
MRPTFYSFLSAFLGDVMRAIFSIIFLLLVPVASQAWGVVYDMGGTDYPRINQITLDSPENAQQKVDEYCQAFPLLRCRIIGQPQEDAMIAIFMGDVGRGFGADKDAKVAIHKARKECEEISKNCMLEHLTYVGKNLYAGVVFGQSRGYYVHTNAYSLEIAQKKALELCMKIDASRECSVVNSMGGRGNEYYSSATSESGRIHAINASIRDNRYAAVMAIKRCEVDSGERCALRIDQAINYGQTEISEKNQKVRSELSNRMLENRKVLARKHAKPISNSPTNNESSGSILKGWEGCGWKANPDDKINPHMIPKPC